MIGPGSQYAPGSAYRGSRLWVEVLESRYLLSGVPVADSIASAQEVLTVSFAPDGTDVSGSPSALYSTLGSERSDLWQADMVRAIETWAAHLELDVRIVPDDGTAFGTPLGGEHIRIGAIAMSSDVLATAIPLNHAQVDGWSGSIFLNSSRDFSTSVDVFSVVLHEAGHVLGLSHSDDPGSVMYAHGGGYSTQPTVDDIALLETLHAFEPPAADDAAASGWAPADVDRIFSQVTDFKTDSPTASFEIASTQFVHFVFADAAGSLAPGPVTQLVLRDSSGVIVRQADGSSAGQSLVVLLQPGTYTVETTMSMQTSLDAGAPRPLVEVLDRHLGPEIGDPSGAPITPCSDGPGEFCYPDEIHAWDTFVWIDDEWVMEDSDESGPPLSDPGWWTWYIELISGV